ncbi:MAG: A/G-specific adenine glycosylase [Bacteroidota bacterium]
MNNTNFSTILIEWYLRNGRSFPWRETKNPYKIWISEVIFQQTRIEQGFEYYNSFIKKFPTIEKLAISDLNSVLKSWQGLGYYSRAINLHTAANHILKEFNGGFPEKYDDILKLKGVGEYIAAAIASFAFKLPYPVIDGNVFRFISRFFAIDTPIDTSKGKLEIKEALDKVFDSQNPDSFNQAIMDFGSLICSKSNPKCNTCPFANSCKAYKLDIVSALPLKTKKTKVRSRFLFYLIIKNKNNIYVNKRNLDGIWKNLYDFPCIETEINISTDELIASKMFNDFFKNEKLTITKVSEVYAHQLSHQLLNIKFIHVESAIKLQNYTSININDFSKLPISKIIEKYFKKNELY